MPGSMLNADLCGKIKSESEVYFLPGLAEEMGNIFKKQGVTVLSVFKMLNAEGGSEFNPPWSGLSH